MAVVLDHALSMKATHGGKAKRDQIDAHKIAVLRRGGMLPQASGDPAERRATRDWRRRRSRRRHRAALLSQVQQTHRPYSVPESGQNIADQANREGVAERCSKPATQKRLAVDLTRLGYDGLRTELALCSAHTAQEPNAQVCYRLRSRRGGGKFLALVLLDAIHAIQPALPWHRTV
jgi:hypothetical protein